MDHGVGLDLMLSVGERQIKAQQTTSIAANNGICKYMCCPEPMVIATILACLLVCYREIVHLLGSTTHALRKEWNVFNSYLIQSKSVLLSLPHPSLKFRCTTNTCFLPRRTGFPSVHTSPAVEVAGWLRRVLVVPGSKPVRH